MAGVSPFDAYNLVVGSLTAAGLVYLLYARPFDVENARFIAVLVTGLFVFSVGGPVTHLLAPEYVHFVHGLAALLVILGLYDPVQNDLRRDEWAQFLVEPRTVRHPADWMAPMDDRVLELFHTTHLVLSPSIIAYNIGYSREEVNRRLSTLEAEGLIERVERGKYRITELGEQYLRGRLHVDEQDGES